MAPATTTLTDERQLAIGVGIGDDLKPAKARARLSRPKWESATRARLRRTIRRFDVRLEQLLSTRANEFATLQFISDFLKTGLGYEQAGISVQHRLTSREIADCVVLVEGKPILLIEVKKAGLRLSSRHLAQLETCAASAEVEWAVLTNGRDWLVYRVTVSDGISSSSELTIRTTFGPDAAEDLFYLTNESMARRQILEHWKRERALSKASLSRAVTSKAVLNGIRRQLHRGRGGVLLDTKQIAERLEDALLGPTDQHWSSPSRRRTKTRRAGR